MRVIRFRIITRKFERRSGKLLTETVRECASPAGAAAVLWREPVGDAMKHNPYSKILLTTTFEIGNGRGWIEYEPNTYQNVLKLKEDLIHAADLHLAFYDDGEGRSTKDGI